MNRYTVYVCVCVGVRAEVRWDNSVVGYVGLWKVGSMETPSPDDLGSQWAVTESTAPSDSE